MKPMGQRERAEWVRRQDARDAAGTVYFIRAHGTPFVKIGFTAGKPERRLYALQNASPHLLVIEARLPGSESLERACQRIVADRWVRREWFWLSEDDVRWLLCEARCERERARRVRQRLAEDGRLTVAEPSEFSPRSPPRAAWRRRAERVLGEAIIAQAKRAAATLGSSSPLLDEAIAVGERLLSEEDL